MTRKLFWDDPYRTAAPAVVATVAGDLIMLDETVFFAFAGGQERDHGTIGGYPVLDARWDQDDIVYRLPADHTLRPGYAVHVVVDAARRDRLRRLHMATEIVLVALIADDPSLEKIGAHISADRARIDFAAAESLSGRLPTVSTNVNGLIEEDHEIVRAYAEGSTTRRYWEIEGFGRVPCGGTLPARTGEIGRVQLKRRNPGRAKERVEITLA